jgi:hypothetical protein
MLPLRERGRRLSATMSASAPAPEMRRIDVNVAASKRRGRSAARQRSEFAAKQINAAAVNPAVLQCLRELPPISILEPAVAQEEDLP